MAKPNPSEQTLRASHQTKMEAELVRHLSAQPVDPQLHFQSWIKSLPEEIQPPLKSMLIMLAYFLNQPVCNLRFRDFMEYLIVTESEQRIKLTELPTPAQLNLISKELPERKYPEGQKKLRVLLPKMVPIDNSTDGMPTPLHEMASIEMTLNRLAEGKRTSLHWFYHGYVDLGPSGL